MTSSCEHVKAQLGLYVDEELAPEQCQVIEAHLSECPDCLSECCSLQDLAASIVDDAVTNIPDNLWPAIEARLDQQSRSRVPFVKYKKRVLGMAACIALFLGIGIGTYFWLGSGVQEAQASPVDFGILLDGVSFDAQSAFQKFINYYDGREITLAQARLAAPTLNYAIPDLLPNNYVLQKVYQLRFGNQPGLATSYTLNGQALFIIIHAAAKEESFGVHQDTPCVVGQHHGHQVSVGAWKMVHLTDSTTCHCLLSTIDDESRISQVLSAVANEGR